MRKLTVDRKEVWKQIADSPNYMVSNLGNVKNLKTGRNLIGAVNNKGYHRYDLCINGKRVAKNGHRLVAEAFLPRVEGKDIINHKDGNKLNNNVENLEWCTCKENSVHAFSVLKRKSWNRKPIRCIETGKVYPSAYEAAREMGVSNGHINNCCNKTRKTAYGYHWEFVEKLLT